MSFNYSQICSNLLRVLPEKQKKVISRRFALLNGESEQAALQRETLESIGESYGITRERVRQIEKDGFFKLKSGIKKYQKVFQYFDQYLKSQGGLKKESSLLEELGGRNHQNRVYFLLSLGENFERFAETPKLHSLWAIDRSSLVTAEKVIDSLFKRLEKAGKPLRLNELANFVSVGSKTLSSYLEVSKKIQKGPEGSFGLENWPEIKPRGVKDKAYLVFKKEKKPLHFREVASAINSALPQTVHNELIKDQRFTLVGRGLYALKEWGYEQGYVKDVILRVLKTAQKPLTKEEILEKVLKQRLVKENTILLNLSNKKYFNRTPEGFYTFKTKVA
jgi:hypothetical protein